MSFRVWLKTNVADKVLFPVRAEIISLVQPGESLLEIGSGTGDLLFQSSSKISHGCGVDIDKKMIEHSKITAKERNINNIDFICNDVRNLEIENYDISTSTLCLHELPENIACEILLLMISNSKIVVIADYTSSDTFLGKLSIEIDEFFSGHYRNYRKYKAIGELPYYANKLGARINDIRKTKIDGISLWIIEGEA